MFVDDTNIFISGHNLEKLILGLTVNNELKEISSLVVLGTGTGT